MFLKVTALFFGLLMTATGQSSRHRCPHEEVCVCSGQSIECKCLQKENIKLLPFLRLDVTSIKIDGCGLVEVLIAFHVHLNIQVFEFRNIEHLHFNSFALSGDTGARLILLENINDLLIDSFGLSGIENLHRLEIRNVTANLTDLAILGQNITSILIENSRLYTQSFSIILRDSNDFQIKSCSFEQTNSSSFVLMNTNVVSIENSVFKRVQPSSFSLTLVDRFEIVQCSFHDIPYDLFKATVNNFYFQKNHIKHSETGAFINFYVQTSARVEGNTFQYLEENSIFPYPNNNSTRRMTTFTFSENIFMCNCHLFWLFNNTDVYAHVLSSGSCSNYRNVELIQLTRMFPHCDSSDFQETAVMKRISEGQTLTNSAPIFHLNICKQFNLFIVFYGLTMVRKYL